MYFTRDNKPCNLSLRRVIFFTLQSAMVWSRGLSIDGKVQVIRGRQRIGDSEIVVLDYETALDSYWVDGERVEYDGALYCDYGCAYRECVSDGTSQTVTLREIDKIKLSYDHYLYSYGKRKYYRLEIDKSLLENNDVILDFDFVGLNLHVFWWIILIFLICLVR